MPAKKKVGTFFHFRYVDGTTYKGKNLSAWCKKMNLSYDAMRRLLHGITQSHKRLWYGSHPVSQKLWKRAQRTLVNSFTGASVSLGGHTYESLAKHLKLHHKDLANVFEGRLIQYKGWKLKAASTAEPEENFKKPLDFLLGHAMVSNANKREISNVGGLESLRACGPR